VKNPEPLFIAKPLPNNILEWHYLIFGPEETDYQGGVYHGQVIFPLEYPFKAPSILMSTPSGRFETNARLCLSMTDFHQEQWSNQGIKTIMIGLISFMTEDAPGTGSITASKQVRQKYAASSMSFNLKNPTFVKLFPEIIAKHKNNTLTITSTSSSTPSSSSQQTTNINNNNNNNNVNNSKSTTTTTAAVGLKSATRLYLIISTIVFSLSFMIYLYLQ